MWGPILLAHGSLGAFDELIMLGIAVVFVGMMAISWFKSRMTDVHLENDDTDQKTPSTNPEHSSSTSHFPLE